MGTDKKSKTKSREKKMVLVPISPDDPISQMVGCVASTWAHFEHSLDTIIWDLLEVEKPKAACITAQIMGAAPRCKTIIALCKYHGISEKVATKVVALLNKSYETTDARNRIVHDPWYATAGDAPSQFKSMPYKEWVYGIAPIPQGAINKTLSKIRGLVKDASELRRLVRGELGASREKHK